MTDELGIICGWNTRVECSCLLAYTPTSVQESRCTSTPVGHVTQ